MQENVQLSLVILWYCYFLSQVSWLLGLYDIETESEFYIRFIFQKNMLDLEPTI